MHNILKSIRITIKGIQKTIVDLKNKIPKKLSELENDLDLSQYKEVVVVTMTSDSESLNNRHYLSDLAIDEIYDLYSNNCLILTKVNGSLLLYNHNKGFVEVSPAESSRCKLLRDSDDTYGWFLYTTSGQEEFLQHVSATPISELVTKSTYVIPAINEINAKATPATDKEILESLVETGFVDPVTTTDGKFLTDNEGKLYIL